jgi:hypothetical protein
MCQRLSLARVEMLLVSAEHTEALWSLERRRREDKSTRWLTSGYGTKPTSLWLALISGFDPKRTLRSLSYFDLA